MALQLLALALAAAVPACAYQVRKIGARSAGAPLLPLPEHPWPHARGPIPGQYGTSGAAAPPRDLSAALAWSFHHPGGQFHSAISGGPVIDRALNLYLVMVDGVRKLSTDGQELWYYAPPGGVMNNEACLYGDVVLSSSQSGHAFALDAATGKALWERQLAASAGEDCGYPAAHDGVFVVGAETPGPEDKGGNTRVFGLDVGSGEVLWEFRPEAPVWNLTPLFPGDGTAVFMDFTGGVYRLGVHNGTLLWHARPPRSEVSFSDGGASLSPDGSVFTCSNYGASAGTKGTQGALRAFSLAQGRLLWERILAQPCNSYPAVGSLDGGGGLSVVVTPGPFFGQPALPGSIVAFDPATGEPQWEYQAPPFTGSFFLARGELRGYAERTKADPRHPLCGPAHWSAPTISSDGTVFVGRMDGFLYAVHGPPGGQQQPAAVLAAANGTSSPGVSVSVFDAAAGSLHGATAWAPGIFAFASCDTLYVFKY